MKTLLIIDIQNDFLPGGNLAVTEGDKTIPYINGIIPEYELVVATLDWHPNDHGSFAANHEAKNPGELVDLNGLDQILWPTHCVQGTTGAAFPEELNATQIDKVVQKGMNPLVDSYSGFFDNGKREETELHNYLQEKQVTELDIVGLATDYCVKFTVLDALDHGYAVNLLTAGCRGVDLQKGDVEKAIAQMKDKGATIINN